MKDKQILEYHPNGKLKHRIDYYINGTKHREWFFDKNGKSHRKNGPDYQSWYENGMVRHKTFYYHDTEHNIYNPSNIGVHFNGKISYKIYSTIFNQFLNKLNWQNKIKNV